jgi:hypothetical protein
MAFLMLTRMFRLDNPDKKNLTDTIYHAHYTANLIEDQIRVIRREDYPFRKKYSELKGGNDSE